MVLNTTKSDDKIFVTMVKRYNSQLFISWMTARMKEKGWGMRETAKKVGVSHPVISEILNGEQPSEKTCVLLAIVFDTAVEYVLNIGGHYQPKDVDGDIQKKTLLSVADGLSKDEVEEVIQYARFKREQK